MARNKGPRVIITGDVKDLEKKLGQAEGSIAGFSNRSSKAFKGLGIAAAGIGAAAVGGFAIGSWALEQGTQVETFGAKADVVFGDQAESVKTWADEVNGSLGLSEAQVLGLAGAMGDLLVPMGFSRDAAAEMSSETIELAGALSAWSGGQKSAAEVSEVLTAAYLGERDGLKALGVSISQAEVDEKALEIARLDGRDAITEQDKAMATQQLVMEKTSDAQAFWNSEQAESIKKSNEMKAKFADLKDEVATRLLPVVNRLVAWAVDDMVPAFEDIASWVQENWPQIQATITDAVQQIMDVVIPIIDALKEAWKIFGDDILASIEVAFDFIKQTFDNAFQIIEGVWNTFKGLFTGDWELMWTGIKNIFSGLWNQLVNILKTVWPLFKIQLSLLWDGMKLAFGDGVSAIVGFFTGLPDRAIAAASSLISAGATFAKDVTSSIKDGLVNSTWKVINWFSGLPRSVADAAGRMKEKMLKLGKDIVQKIVDGIKAAPSALLNALKSILPSVSDLTGGIGNALGRIPGLAHGGTGTGTFIAGEAGPEIIRLSGGSANVTSNRELGLSGLSGLSAGITVNMYGTSVTAESLGQELVWLMNTAGR